MNPLLAEFIGTLVIILLGDGVVANVSLARSKGERGGWMVVTTGWALAVTLAVYMTNAISGGHLNPAVTVGMAAIGKFAWAQVLPYIAAQLAGAFTGAVLVWLAYLPHWRTGNDPATTRGVFCTAPAVRQPAANMLTELIGTALLVFGVLTVITPENLVPNSGFDTAFPPVLVGLIVWAIGLSLGGPTGYAINPVRDLGPRLAHAVLPIPGKGDSDWGYALVPIVGPLLGGVTGAWLYHVLWPATQQ